VEINFIKFVEKMKISGFGCDNALITSSTCYDTMFSYERQRGKTLDTKLGEISYSNLIILGIEKNYFRLKERCPFTQGLCPFL